MRLLVDALVAFMLAAIIAGVLWHHRAESAAQAAVAETRESVRAIARQISLEVALHEATAGADERLMTIDPAWFQPHLPENPLVDQGHPWLEVALPEERLRRHPRERLASDKALAKFWFNPANGIVRARVGPGASDAAALDLYNRVNDSELTSLYADAQ
jgi:hypothetical protein